MLCISAAYAVMRCLCVRVSVTFMSCVETNKHISSKFFHHRVKVKVKVKESIVLREIHLRTTGRHLSMGSPGRGLHPNRACWYSIYRPRKDERLSWPSWLVTYRNCLPIHRRSPIRVLTGSDVAQLR